MSTTPLGDWLRELAHWRRGLAAANPDDPRHARGAEALDELAATADREVHAAGFYASRLVRYHLSGGELAWPDGQSGRAASNWGFDSPVAGPDAHEAFLGDLWDLATRDACQDIARHEADLDRADAAVIAERWGMSAERVHGALDMARYPHLYQVGIPHWHALTAEMRRALDTLDGAWVEPVSATRNGDERPTYVNNVGAPTAEDACRIVGRIVELDPDDLGAGIFPRVSRPSSG